VNDLSGLRLISEKAQVIDVGSEAGGGGARGEVGLLDLIEDGKGKREKRGELALWIYWKLFSP
jgi:hypothetical protein